MSGRVELESIEEGFRIVSDKNLDKIYDLFKKDFSRELKMKGIYLSDEEIFEGIKERIFDSINERYLDLKSRISHLRKKGKEVSVDDYNLLRAPLKIKMFFVNFDTDNYKVVLSIFNKTESIISEIEKELEKEEAEKEKRILEKERNEKKNSPDIKQEEE